MIDGTSEAEDESGDGYSNSKLDLTSKSKGTEVIRFEDTDHMTTMLLEVHTKEAAGASTWGKDTDDITFRREGKAYHSFIQSVRTLAIPAHKHMNAGLKLLPKGTPGRPVRVPQVPGEKRATDRRDFSKDRAISDGTGSGSHLRVGTSRNRRDSSSVNSRCQPFHYE